MGKYGACIGRKRKVFARCVNDKKGSRGRLNPWAVCTRQIRCSNRARRGLR